MIRFSKYVCRTLTLTLLVLCVEAQTDSKIPPLSAGNHQNSKEINLVTGSNSPTWQLYDITHQNPQITIKSSNYPKSYGEDEQANILFTGPFDSLIYFFCETLNIEQDSCRKDYLAISPAGRTDFADGGRVCGQERNFNKTTVTNRMAFSFVSGKRVLDSVDNYGFKCVLSLVPNEVRKPTITKAGSVPYVQNESEKNSKCDCGVKNQSTRIVNGDDTAVNEIPWRCYMSVRKTGPFCGCTIIDSMWVMTAAHCTAPILKMRNKVRLDEVYVVGGDHDVYNATDTNHVAISVKNIIPHLNYDPETQDNDISLLHLSEPMPWSKIISPACLPWHGEGHNCETRINVMASGWGVTSAAGGGPSSVLRKVELPCMSSASCQSYYHKQIITDNMICTYTPGKDACQGDSGGSIDYKDPETGSYTAIGIVSWGVGCATPNKPGVFTKVANYVSWIKDQTKGALFCGA